MRDVHLTDDPTTITEVVDDPGFQNPASTAHFNVTIYDSDDETEETYTLPIETINVEATKPHPEYTSCTPITRSIMVGDDSNYMTFIPYSDDPTFNHEAQTLHYDHFAWQSIQDPDGISTHPPLLPQLDVTNIGLLALPLVEVICAQAVKMLMKEHGLTLQQILDTKVMPPNIIQKITSLLGARRRYSRIPIHHFLGLMSFGIETTPNGHQTIPSIAQMSPMNRITRTCHPHKRFKIYFGTFVLQAAFMGIVVFTVRSPNPCSLSPSYLLMI